MIIRNPTPNPIFYGWMAKLGIKLAPGGTKEVDDAITLKTEFRNDYNGGKIEIVSFGSEDYSLLIQKEGETLIATHASNHIYDGIDEIDGDKIDIDYTPSSYTPSTIPPQVDNVHQLTAHLAAIDLEIASPKSHKDTHISSGTDEIDGDKVDIDWDPSNYTPDDSIAESDSVDELSAHLKGIDTAIGGMSAPDPKVISIVKTVADGDKSGSVVNSHRIFNFSASGTSDFHIQFQVPDNWDTSVNPKVSFCGFSTGDDAGHAYRLEVGAEYVKPGEVLLDTEDETVTWTETAPDADDVFMWTAEKELDKSLIEQGDEIHLFCKRIGGDGADTRTGYFRFFGAKIEFARSDLGIYI